MLPCVHSFKIKKIKINYSVYNLTLTFSRKFAHFLNLTKFLKVKFKIKEFKNRLHVAINYTAKITFAFSVNCSWISKTTLMSKTVLPSRYAKSVLAENIIFFPGIPSQNRTNAMCQVLLLILNRAHQGQVYNRGSITYYTVMNIVKGCFITFTGWLAGFSLYRWHPLDKTSSTFGCLACTAASVSWKIKTQAV